MSNSKPPMTQIAIPVPNSEQYDLNKYLPPGMDFNELVMEIQTLNEQAAAAKAKADEYRQLIQAVMDIAKVKSVVARMPEDLSFTVTRVEPSRRSKLDKNLLLQHGVTPQQIQQATVYSQGAPYVTIRPVNKHGEPEGEQE
jgi:hypothetical protein